MTPEQRTALIDKLLSNVTPERPHQAPLADRIRAWRPQFRTYRAKGYSWKQLVEIANNPKVNLPTKESSLTRIVSSRKGRAAVDGLTTQRRDEIFAELTKEMTPDNPPLGDVLAAMKEWEEPLQAKASLGFTPEQLAIHVAPEMNDVPFKITAVHMKALLHRPKKKGPTQKPKNT